MTLEPADEESLFRLGDESIRAGLDGRSASDPRLAALPPGLRQHAAVFVTLLVVDELNGCIGSLDPEPLGPAVSRLAWDAAFADPRLPRLGWAEYPELSMKISLLSELAPVEAASREELVAGLRPGLDGLLLDAGGRRATFLPAVWETLPEPVDFVDQLQAKAGVPAGSWPAGTRAWRYVATELHRHVRDLHRSGC